jgi:isoamyl acetate esterase
MVICPTYSLSVYLLVLVFGLMQKGFWQTVCVGGNDATVPRDTKSLPIEEYIQNMRKILQHPLVESHSPHLILITPAPLDERACYALDLARDEPVPTRDAKRTKEYAEACLSLGNDIGVETIHLWGLIMAEIGWKKGDQLPGSMEAEENTALVEFLDDGNYCCLRCLGLYELTAARLAHVR